MRRQGSANANESPVDRVTSYPTDRYRSPIPEIDEDVGQLHLDVREQSEHDEIGFNQKGWILSRDTPLAGIY